MRLATVLVLCVMAMFVACGSSTLAHAQQTTGGTDQRAAAGASGSRSRASDTVRADTLLGIGIRYVCGDDTACRKCLAQIAAIAVAERSGKPVDDIDPQVMEYVLDQAEVYPMVLSLDLSMWSNDPDNFVDYSNIRLKYAAVARCLGEQNPAGRFRRWEAPR